MNTPKLFLIQFAVKGTLTLDSENRQRIVLAHSIFDLYKVLVKDHPKNDVWVYPISEPIYFPEWYGKTSALSNASEVW